MCQLDERNVQLMHILFNEQLYSLSEWAVYKLVSAPGQQGRYHGEGELLYSNGSSYTGNQLHVQLWPRSIEILGGESDMSSQKITKEVK